jgi:hypothetical protein
VEHERDAVVSTKPTKATSQGAFTTAERRMLRLACALAAQYESSLIDALAHCNDPSDARARNTAAKNIDQFYRLKERLR